MAGSKTQALVLTALMVLSAFVVTTAFSGVSGASFSLAPAGDRGAGIDSTTQTVPLRAALFGGGGNEDASTVPAREIARKGAAHETGATPQAITQVTETDSAAVSFTQSVFEEEQGDVAAIGINLTGSASTVTLVIGDESIAGYQANVSVTDGDGDGEVVVLFNTYTAGTKSAPVSTADADDSATLLSDDTGLRAILDTGDYDLAVGLDSDPSAVKAKPDDLASLFLSERSVGSAILWTAPKDTDVSTRAKLVSATTRTSSVAEQDLAIIEFEASGLEGLIDLYGGLETAFLADDVLGLSINQTDASTPTNSDPKAVDVGVGIKNDDINFVSDVTNDTYYVIIDTADVTFVSNNQIGFAAGEVYVAVVSIEDDWLLGTSDPAAEPSMNTTVQIHERTVKLSDDAFVFEPAAAQTIDGTSSTAPGTEISVVVQSTGNTSPRFVKSASTTVGVDGTWTVAFDFSGQSSGDTCSVTARTVVSDGAVEDTAACEIQAASTPTPTQTDSATTEPDTQTDTQTATATQPPTEPPTDMPTETPTATATPTETPTASPNDPMTASPTASPTGSPTDTPGTTVVTEAAADSPTDAPNEPIAEPPTTTTEGHGFGLALALLALFAAALVAVRRP